MKATAAKIKNVIIDLYNLRQYNDRYKRRPTISCSPGKRKDGIIHYNIPKHSFYIYETNVKFYCNLDETTPFYLDENTILTIKENISRMFDNILDVFENNRGGLTIAVREILNENNATKSASTGKSYSNTNT